jgi:hypothetical protein
VVCCHRDRGARRSNELRTRWLDCKTDGRRRRAGRQHRKCRTGRGCRLESSVNARRVVGHESEREAVGDGDDGGRTTIGQRNIIATHLCCSYGASSPGCSCSSASDEVFTLRQTQPGRQSSILPGAPLSEHFMAANDSGQRMPLTDSATKYNTAPLLIQFRRAIFPSSDIRNSNLDHFFFSTIAKRENNLPRVEPLCVSDIS